MENTSLLQIFTKNVSRKAENRKDFAYLYHFE